MGNTHVAMSNAQQQAATITHTEADLKGILALSGGGTEPIRVSGDVMDLLERLTMVTGKPKTRLIAEALYFQFVKKQEVR